MEIFWFGLLPHLNLKIFLVRLKKLFYGVILTDEILCCQFFLVRHKNVFLISTLNTKLFSLSRI